MLSMSMPPVQSGSMLSPVDQTTSSDLNSTLFNREHFIKYIKRGTFLESSTRRLNGSGEAMHKTTEQLMTFLKDICGEFQKCNTIMDLFINGVQQLHQNIQMIMSAFLKLEIARKYIFGRVAYLNSALKKFVGFALNVLTFLSVTCTVRGGCNCKKWGFPGSSDIITFSAKNRYDSTISANVWLFRLSRPNKTMFDFVRLCSTQLIYVSVCLTKTWLFRPRSISWLSRPKFLKIFICSPRIEMFRLSRPKNGYASTFSTNKIIQTFIRLLLHFSNFIRWDQITSEIPDWRLAR